MKVVKFIHTCAHSKIFWKIRFQLKFIKQLLLRTEMLTKV